MFMHAYHTTRFYECLKKGIHEYLLTHIVLITMQHMTSQTWNLNSPGTSTPQSHIYFDYLSLANFTKRVEEYKFNFIFNVVIYSIVSIPTQNYIYIN